MHPFNRGQHPAEASAVIQWIPDGPELPVEVLEALEDGDLILFCGAGISVPAGLPTFKELVTDVYKSFPDSSNEIDDLIEAHQYDRAVYALETHYGKVNVRRKVSESLQLKLGADRSTHAALLKLATARDSKLRLITTNFDLAFESEDESISVDCAPKLPIPKKERWNSLVYLHGRLDPSDPACDSLVLSSADFGLAYLTEAWASRFVTELFRRFKVLFVGYRADDPVMRYMLDAFAADRDIGESVSTAFAFADAGPDKFEEVSAKWKSKRVRPIIYKTDERGHERLHLTLKRWAASHASGLQGKSAIILEHRRSPAVPSSRQQVCWALRDPTGYAARTFADLEPPAPLDWLQHLEEAGLFNLHESAFSKDAKLKSPLCSGSVPLNAPGHPISRHLANWLVKHLNDRRLADWVVERGTYLHEFLRLRIRERLCQELPIDHLTEGLRRFWGIVSSEDYASSLSSLNNSAYELSRRLQKGQWDSILRREVIAAFTPFLRLERPWARIFGETSGSHFSDYAKGALLLRAEQDAGYIYQAVTAHKDRRRVLLDLVDESSHLLDRICDLLTLSEEAGDGFDNTYIFRPSIEQDEQTMAHYPWLTLVSLARDIAIELAGADPSRGRLLVNHWRGSKIPLLRRLALFAASKTELFSESEAVELLLEQNQRWLWSHFVQREAFQLIESVWPRLNEAEGRKLTDAILAGPPREMFLKSVEDDVYLEHRNAMVQGRLECIEHTSRKLPLDAQKYLAELRPSGYTAGLPEDGSRFPFFSTAVFGDPTLHRFDPEYDLRKLGKNEQAIIIAGINPDSPYASSWRVMVREDIQEAAKTLVDLGAESKWSFPAWKELMQSLPASGKAISLWPVICPTLSRLPDLSAVANELAGTLREISGSLPVQEEDCFWTLWDRVAPGVTESNLSPESDILFLTLNSASGGLAETVLNRMQLRKPEVGTDIPETIWDRLTKLLEFQQPGAVLAKVLLASRLPWLFKLQRVWVQTKLLPLFNWESNPDAGALWQGYLWQFSMPADLWPLIKKDYLEAVRLLTSSKGAENAASLFTAICIRQPGWIDYPEAAETLKTLTARGRSESARVLWEFMRAAGEKADELWRERIGPWIEGAWPRDQSLRDSSISVHLALTAIQTTQEFPAASRLVLEVITKSPDVGWLIRHLKETRLPLADTYPRDLLRVLGAIFDANSQEVVGSEVLDILHRIKQACPDCVSDPDYKRLYEWGLAH